MGTTRLEPYHLVWLAAHPRREEEWLRARLTDGFDVHHVDGDHQNNDSVNLMLMECSDHMLLHNTEKGLTHRREKDAERAKRWREKHRDQYNEYQRERRARLKETNEIASQ